jgi:hypothetical protein
MVQSDTCRTGHTCDVLVQSDTCRTGHTCHVLVHSDTCRTGHTWPIVKWKSLLSSSILSQYIVPSTVHMLKRVIKSIYCSTFSTKVHL